MRQETDGVLLESYLIYEPGIESLSVAVFPNLLEVREQQVGKTVFFHPIFLSTLPLCDGGLTHSVGLFLVLA